MNHEPYLLPNGRVLRYSFQERLIHWMAGVSYVYLLLTGLAFWTPWLAWLLLVLGGGSVSRELHNWFGLLFMVAVFLMFRMWGGQMRETPADRSWWSAVGHYIRNEDEKVPSADRFNPGQKLLFWGFFVCGILLLLSGLVLWFPQYVPWGIGAVRPLAAFVHGAAFLLTVGLFIIHVYMGTAFERGSFGSVIRGDVSRAWASQHHHTWYQQLLGKSSTQK